MVSRSPRFQALFDLADNQLGLVTATQISELGIAYSTVTRRVAGGMWTRVLPGVHLVKGGHPVAEQRELATLLYAGTHSCLTGLTGVRRHGMRGSVVRSLVADVEPVHALIPHDARSKSTGFARVERTRRLPEPVRLDGLRVAPFARCLADAARRMHRERDVLDLVASALQQGLCSWDDLKHELDAGQRRGSAHLRSALGRTAIGVHSAPESDVAGLLASVGIKGARFNVVLLDEDGGFVGMPDVWLEEGVAIEVDSVEHHSEGDGFRRTVRRNARYAAAGVAVVPVLPSDVRRRPGAVLAWVDAARVSAAERPRPRVQVLDRSEVSAWKDEWRWGA